MITIKNISEFLDKLAKYPHLKDFDNDDTL
jgi:hypothetical protein